MSDKLVAGLVTAAVVGPICSICILGPTFVVSWIGGWFAGLDAARAGGLALIAVILAYALIKRRRAQRKGLQHREARAPHESKRAGA